jgi:hypothetical protein
LKTASFFHYTGLGRVSIARSAPPRIVPGYTAYPKLAPGPWFNAVDRHEYERRYASQLARLDAEEVWEELHNVAGGFEPILMCWEDLTDGKSWCHRRLVAEWFWRELREGVLELTVETVE